MGKIEFPMGKAVFPGKTVWPWPNVMAMGQGLGHGQIKVTKLINVFFPN